MIKLTLPPKPDRLTENETRLTSEFKADNNKTVWKQSYITEPLLEMTHNKCAYSETRLNEKSNYMEVEHFRHKSKYPEDVVKWGNLLPSCKTCNTAKSKWDVVEEPIVNPLTDTPNDHLYIKGGRFYPKDDKGANTIIAVALNDNDQFVIPRFMEATAVVSHLEEAFESIKDADTIRKITFRLNNIKKIFRQCGPESAYSAFIATYRLYEWPIYHDMEAYLKSKMLWDDELESLKTVIESIALPPV